MASDVEQTLPPHTHTHQGDLISFVYFFLRKGKQTKTDWRHQPMYFRNNIKIEWSTINTTILIG